MSESEKKKPTVKNQAVQTYVQVETGIYRYKDKDGEISYHERPFIPGMVSKYGNPVRTYRSLGFLFTKQTNLENARTEYHRRRTELAAGRNPYAVKEPEKLVEKPLTSKIITNYVDAGFPDRYLRPRTGRTLDSETANCETLLEYFNDQELIIETKDTDGEVVASRIVEAKDRNVTWDKLTPLVWDTYHEWRVSTVKAGCTGARSVDAERVTFSNAFKYALRKAVVTANPVETFNRFQPESDIQHCREFQPQNAEELHSVAALFFANPRSETLGWQLLYEAYTGMRTEEVLMLRDDAKPTQPGFVALDGNLHIERVKRGVNPFVQINEGLRAVMAAHKAWQAVRYPHSHWFFPARDRDADKPIHKNSLAHALRRMRKEIGRKITSHGMRAWFVLVLRSWGIDDPQIGWKLGQRSGGDLISSTYGDIPDNWKTDGAPKLAWLPADPAKYAWAALEKNDWKFQEPGEVEEELAA